MIEYQKFGNNSKVSSSIYNENFKAQNMVISVSENLQYSHSAKFSMISLLYSKIVCYLYFQKFSTYFFFTDAKGSARMGIILKKVIIAILILLCKEWLNLLAFHYFENVNCSIKWPWLNIKNPLVTSQMLKCPNAKYISAFHCSKTNFYIQRAGIFRIPFKGIYLTGINYPNTHIYLFNEKNPNYLK